MHKSLRWFIVFSQMSQFSDNCDGVRRLREIP